MQGWRQDGVALTSCTDIKIFKLYIFHFSEQSLQFSLYFRYFTCHISQKKKTCCFYFQSHFAPEHNKNPWDPTYHDIKIRNDCTILFHFNFFWGRLQRINGRKKIIGTQLWHHFPRNVNISPNEWMLWTHPPVVKRLFQWSYTSTPNIQKLQIARIISSSFNLWFLDSSSQMIHYFASIKN